MGANNYTRCPRCYQEAAKVFDNLKVQVDALYGKVPVEEFDAKRAALAKMHEKLEGEATYRTFREDYDITGAADGLVHVSYRSGCAICKLQFKFETDHPIPGV